MMQEPENNTENRSKLMTLNFPKDMKGRVKLLFQGFSAGLSKSRMKM